MDIARSTDKTIEQLFDDLGNINRLHSEESSFRRGLAHLRSVKAPLDNLKLALDLANPLVSFEPTAAIIVGIVRGVTTVAISLASADLEFAKLIGDMLEQKENRGSRLPSISIQEV